MRISTTHLLVGFELAFKDDCCAALGVEDIEELVVRVLSAENDCFSSELLRNCTSSSNETYFI